MEDNKKNYEEALEYLKRIRNANKNNKELVDFIEFHYPEIKESDDERIRKTLKSFFDSEISDYGNVEWRNGIRYGEIVAWLEQQGEQKGIDYDEELKKCKDNPLYFYDKYVRIKLKEQKPAWSEEDERHLNLSLENLTELKDRFSEEYGIVGDCIAWLSSIKERMKGGDQ